MIKRDREGNSTNKQRNKKTEGNINLRSLMALTNESDMDALALSVERGTQYEVDLKSEERLFKRVMKKITRLPSRDSSQRNL